MKAKGFIIITAGTEDWDPTTEELNSLADMFRSSLDEHFGKEMGANWLVVTLRRGIDVGIHRIDAKVGSNEGVDAFIAELRHAVKMADLKIREDGINVSVARLE